MKYLKIVILVLLGIHLININYKAYYDMREDKMKAENGLWRISEQELFNEALLGGAIGIELAMYDFPSGDNKHKVSKASWRVGIPALILNHFFIISLVVYLFYKSRIRKAFFVLKNASTNQLRFFEINSNKNLKYIIHDLPEEFLVKNEFYSVKSKTEKPWENKTIKEIKP